MKQRALFLAACLFGECIGLLRAELPPDAQAAVEKGITSAKAQDWQSAIQNFQDARKIAPNSPEILFNLGLAESKMPGRELRAIAWFSAYLAANPTASNQAAVKGQIALLDSKCQTNIRHLIQSAEDAALRVPIGPANAWPVPGNYQRNSALKRVAYLWASIGDIGEANRLIDQLQEAIGNNMGLQGGAKKHLIEIEVENAASKARVGDIEGAQDGRKILPADQTDPLDDEIAQAQSMTGDFDRAMYTIRSMKSAGWKDPALRVMAGKQVEIGDIAGAFRTVAMMQDEAKMEPLSLIAQAQAKEGNISDALKTIELILGITSTSSPGGQKDIACEAVAIAQIESGDIAGALKTSTLISKQANGSCLDKIAEAQAQRGDIPGALTTAATIAENDDYTRADKSAALIEIAKAQIATNDIPSAKSTINVVAKIVDLLPLDFRGYAKKVDLAGLQSLIGDVAAANRTADSIGDAYYKTLADTDVAIGQASGGDFSAALNVVDSIEESKGVKYSALGLVIGAQIKAKEFPAAVKTAAEIQQDSMRWYELRTIAEGQAKSGDFAGATHLIETIDDAENRAEGELAIAAVQVKDRDLIGAKRSIEAAQMLTQGVSDDGRRKMVLIDIEKMGSRLGKTLPQNPSTQTIEYAKLEVWPPAISVADWIAKLDSSYVNAECPLNTAPFLDLEGVLKSLPSSSDFRGILDFLEVLDGKLIKAQRTIEQMLKQDDIHRMNQQARDRG